MGTSILSQLLTQGTQARNAFSSGQQQQRETGIKDALEQLQLQRQQKEDAIKQALTEAQAGHFRAQSEALLRPPPAPRDYVKEHELNRKFDIDHPLPTEAKPPMLGTPEYLTAEEELAKMRAKYATGPTPQIVQGVTAPGEPPKFFRIPRTAGAATEVEGLAPKPTGTGVGSAPMAAKVGQAGEMMKKLEDVFNASEKMSVGVGQSAARDIAEHGVGVGSMRIPGTKGVGNVLLNKTPEYAQYQAALSPFILAAAHALSGARINQDQVEQIRRSIELQPGDFQNKTVRAQKEKNLIDLVNSIVGSLPADQMMGQEAQMSPEAIEKLILRGYRRVVPPIGGGRGGGGATIRKGGDSRVNTPGSTGAGPPGPPDIGGGGGLAEQRADWDAAASVLRARGLDDAAIAKELGHPRP